MILFLLYRSTVTPLLFMSLICRSVLSSSHARLVGEATADKTLQTSSNLLCKFTSKLWNFRSALGLPRWGPAARCSTESSACLVNHTNCILSHIGSHCDSIKRADLLLGGRCRLSIQVTLSGENWLANCWWRRRGVTALVHTEKEKRWCAESEETKTSRWPLTDIWGPHLRLSEVLVNPTFPQRAKGAQCTPSSASLTLQQSHIKAFWKPEQNLVI